MGKNIYDDREQQRLETQKTVRAVYAAYCQAVKENEASGWTIASGTPPAYLPQLQAYQQEAALAEADGFRVIEDKYSIDGIYLLDIRNL